MNDFANAAQAPGLLLVRTGLQRWREGKEWGRVAKLSWVLPHLLSQSAALAGQGLHPGAAS